MSETGFGPEAGRPHLEPQTPGCPDWAQAAHGHNSGLLVGWGGRLSSEGTACRLEGRTGKGWLAGPTPQLRALSAAPAVRAGRETRGPAQGPGVRRSRLAQWSGLGEPMGVRSGAGSLASQAASGLWLLASRSGHRRQVRPKAGPGPSGTAVTVRVLAPGPWPRRGRPLLALGEAAPKHCCFHGGRPAFYLFNPSHFVNYSFTFM